MMPRPISRRSLVAAAIGGAAAWLGGYVSFLAVRAGRPYSVSGYRELYALCSDLRCPRTIGKACLLALPATEGTRSSLARTILSDVRPAGGKPSAAGYACAGHQGTEPGGLSRWQGCDRRWLDPLPDRDACLRACRAASRAARARRVRGPFRSDAVGLSRAVRPLMHADCGEARRAA